VIDEQHRFGVKQRQELFRKGDRSDILLMSATPIPRSLSLSFFGDLDISVITQMPAGRKEKYSKILNPQQREHAYSFLMSRIVKGEQGYVIFPVIETSSQQDLRSLKKEYKLLKKHVFKAVPTALLHSKVAIDEREKIMTSFNKGEIKVLFATSVLEVGIDNPGATVLIIESADRFGLAQLHQLRGRIGRGEKESFCYVIKSNAGNKKTAARMELFCRSNDGFKISEYDLMLRGPGEFLGTRQAGIPGFKLAEITKDFKLLRKARRDLLSADNA
ncbi:MAG TPA: helicase-related protein, partial [Spirochaetota bacterium]|nr:helicase-related protein [Spirochaetota bacterium]